MSRWSDHREEQWVARTNATLHPDDYNTPVVEEDPFWSPDYGKGDLGFFGGIALVVEWFQENKPWDRVDSTLYSSPSAKLSKGTENG